MGWYRSPEWGEILHYLDDWWHEAIEKCRDAGIDDNDRLSRGFGHWTYKIVQWCDDAKTGIDPTPFWKMYQSLQRYYPPPRIGGDDAGGRPSKRDLMLLLDETQLAVERLERQGVVQQNPAEVMEQILVAPTEIPLHPRGTVVERLSNAELAVYDVVTRSDIRLTQELVIAETENQLGDDAPRRSRITASLAWFVKAGVISVTPRGQGDEHGHGYGRAEWGQPKV